MQEQDSINELLIDNIQTLHQNTSELLKTSRITGECFDTLRDLLAQAMSEIEDLKRQINNIKKQEQ